MLTENSRIKIESLADEVCKREGCRLYDLEFTTQQGQRILRIYVEGIESHVSVEQCAEISRGLSLLLDVDDPIPGGMYEQEVSSPGIERPLKRLWHFEKALGEKVKIKTNEALIPQNRELRKGENTKGVTGILKEIKDNKFVGQTESDLWVVPLEYVHKAHVVFEFGTHKPMNKRGK